MGWLTGVELGLFSGVEVGVLLGVLVLVLVLELPSPCPKIPFWAPSRKPHSLKGNVRKRLSLLGAIDSLEIIRGIVLAVKHLHKFSAFP